MGGHPAALKTKAVKGPMSLSKPTAIHQTAEGVAPSDRFHSNRQDDDTTYDLRSTTMETTPSKEEKQTSHFS